MYSRVFTILFLTAFFGFAQQDNSISTSKIDKIEELLISVDKRLIRIEEAQAYTKEQILLNREDTRDNRTTLLSIAGILLTAYLALFGFIYWDRRTAVREIEQENKILKTKIEAFEKIFKEIANGKTLTNELLQNYGINTV